MRVRETKVRGYDGESAAEISFDIAPREGGGNWSSGVFGLLDNKVPKDNVAVMYKKGQKVRERREKEWERREKGRERREKE
jgi:hypothetical protein